MWPSWAPVPNKPTVSVDVKATLQQQQQCRHNLSFALAEYLEQEGIADLLF